jgi:hypothetical protein
MKRIEADLWPVVEPHLGFAEATVERMLNGTAVPMPAPRRQKRLVGLLLAAIFVSGAAFGLSGRIERSYSRAVAAAPALPTLAPMQRHVSLGVAPNVPMIAAQPIAVTPKRTVATPATSASNAPVTPPKLPPRVPACQCARGFSDVICDCY